ncbi:MAG TPA: ATP-binding cassette domain-containing protein [Candidatus Hydrogenedentes bacterium]|nr:ATP-binding cassette domain-containing protein [Candidatus Hydrogenedentota bacterium]HPG66360.1 ATP-binding cassette domain-containing protein [Candidatus Hydrogenedentota bacterium]
MSSNGELLVVKDLVKHFPVQKGVFSRVVGAVRAVDGISFGIARGQTLSLVGESGSGKTTAGRALLRLIEPTSGTVLFDGQDVTAMPRGDLRRVRKRMQLIFQDPYGSLNPRMTVYSVLSEAMAAHGIAPREQRRARVTDLLNLVGLSPEAADRYPNEFSGGQRQRIGIARALAVEPDLIVADEPVSALDVSIRAQILNLLEDLQERLGLTYLFIGHDLSVVRVISDRVAVMYLGRIMEIGSVDDVFRRTAHPYTRALLSAVPVVDTERRRTRIVLAGDVPSPINPPSGCHFHPRCPDCKPEICAVEATRLVEVSPGHRAACHIHAPAPPSAAAAANAGG